jgi:hypothetical protein
MKSRSAAVALCLSSLLFILCGSAPEVSGQVFTSAGQIPQFLNPVTYFVPGASMAALADVNGDGILDIVTANGYATNDVNPGGQGVSVLLGNGDGTFQDARTARADGNPSFVAVGDFNNDGKADIAVVNGPGTNTVSVLYGKGDGSFQQLPGTDLVISDTAMVVGLGGQYGTLVAADFNGDGKLDLAVAFSRNSADPNVPVETFTEVWLNNGDGTFSMSYFTSEPAVFAADFDGDGKQDLLVYGISSAVKLGNGDGTFRDGQSNITGLLGGFGFNITATAGDFNGDGLLDVAGVNGANFDENIRMSLGLPEGTFRSTFDAKFRVSSGSNASNYVAADFNGDGKLDIAGFRFVDYGIGDGRFGPVGDTTNFSHVLNAVAVGGSFAPTWVAVGDVDGNGSPDLIAATDGGVVQVVLNTSGHPPLLAKLALFTNLVHSVVGGATTVSGEVDLGGPAPDGGAAVTLSSSDPAASFPDGNTVTIPAGSQSAAFRVSTAAVAASTPVTISATYHRVTLSSQFTVLPRLLAQMTLRASSVVGGATTVTGTVALDGPALPGGALVTLSSSDPAASFPDGNTVVIPAGSQAATFSISTAAVAASTPVTISATKDRVTLNGRFTVVPPFALSSVSFSPASLFGMFGGNPAVGTVTLSGPAADGVVVNLASANADVIALPASVSVRPGATTATFGLNALAVTADTPVAVSGSFQGTTVNGTVTVLSGLDTVVVTKAEYVASKNQLKVEATSTNSAATLRVFNATPGSVRINGLPPAVGTMSNAGGGKFVGQFVAGGPFNSVAVQSSQGGLKTAPVAQK